MRGVRTPGAGRRKPGGTRTQLGMSTLLALSRAIEARDPHSSGHAARVGVLAEIAAARLGWDEADVEVLRTAAALHDIGKIAVPQEVLCKPGPLDEDEFELVR